jgi:hypothetical protein
VFICFIAFMRFKYYFDGATAALHSLKLVTCSSAISSSSSSSLGSEAEVHSGHKHMAQHHE